MPLRITPEDIAESEADLVAAHEADLDHVRAQVARAGLDAEKLEDLGETGKRKPAATRPRSSSSGSPSRGSSRGSSRDSGRDSGRERSSRSSSSGSTGSAEGATEGSAKPRRRRRTKRGGTPAQGE